MRYLALASDYDGTLAHDGEVDESTIRAVELLIHSGRKLILVTGRELPDLQAVFPKLDLCARVVAENGALLYNPSTREKRILAERPPQSFIDDLRRRGVPGVSVGDVIISTWRPHEQEVLDAIRDFGLELQIIFNKEAVMVLPSSVNKRTGLCSALEDLKLSRHNIVGIGDAENDHAFLESCECSVAVANAIPTLKEKADFVTSGARGAGVAELIGKLVDSDLEELNAQLRHGRILVGETEAGEVTLSGHRSNVLVCGQSGSGKSTLVTGLLERIIEQDYQLCLIDPEGDYENLPGSRVVGDEKHAPSIKALKQGLEEPRTQVVVNLVSVSTADRPESFASLITGIQEGRLQTGRPHWLVIDEAHHVLPREWAPAPAALADDLSNLLLITVHPEHVSPVALSKVNTVIVMGRDPRALLAGFAKALDIAVPDAPTTDLERGQALLWFRTENQLLPAVKITPSRSEHSRHKRKYAQGQLDEDRMFHFRGPEGKMDLRAQNLMIFVQLLEGIDAETWSFHLKGGDYSRWLRQALKDAELADQVAAVENEAGLSDAESRHRIKDAILQKYTAPQ